MAGRHALNFLYDQQVDFRNRAILAYTVPTIEMIGLFLVSFPVFAP
jgi:hypothetical protein